MLYMLIKAKSSVYKPQGFFITWTWDEHCSMQIKYLLFNFDEDEKFLKCLKL